MQNKLNGKQGNNTKPNAVISATRKPPSSPPPPPPHPPSSSNSFFFFFSMFVYFSILSEFEKKRSQVKLRVKTTLKMCV
jgi:hypothetical protein